MDRHARTAGNRLSFGLEEGCSVVHFDELAAAARRGDTEFVLQHADDLLLQGECPPERVGWVFYYKSDAALEASRNVLAIAAGEQALTWAERHQEGDLEGRVRLVLSYGLLRLGRVAEAAALLEAFLKGLRRHASWRALEDMARFNLGVAYRHCGRVVEAVQQYRQALLLPESSPGLHDQVRQNLAWALVLLRDAPAARTELEAVADNVRQTLSLSRLTSLWVDRAALCLLEGDTAGARAACHQVLAALDERERGAHLATTYVTLGRIALAEADREEARRCSLLARTHAEQAERWDLHNEGTRLWVSASEKGGMDRDEEDALACAARRLVIGRSRK